MSLQNFQDKFLVSKQMLSIVFLDGKSYTGTTYDFN